MTAIFLSVCVVVVLCASGTHGYSSGAPIIACENMQPQHSSKPQTGAPPYKITLSKTTYSEGSKLNVHVIGTDDSWTIKGFLIMARVASGVSYAPLGKFSSVDDASLMHDSPCVGPWGVARTHTSGDKFMKLNLTWTAPMKTFGNLKFWITIVESEPVQWVGIETDVIKVAGAPGDRTTPQPKTTPRGKTPPKPKATNKDKKDGGWKIIVPGGEAVKPQATGLIYLLTAATVLFSLNCLA